MKFVEKKVLNNRTMDMVEHALLMMCSYIPGRFSDQVISVLVCFKDLDEYQGSFLTVRGVC